MRASCRLTQLRCWVAPSPEVSCPASEPAHFLRSRSSVSLRLVYTWPLFLQALCLFRLVRGPRYAAVRARLQSHKAFRAARRQPFRLQAQTVSEQVRHRLRREVSARQHTLPRTSYPDRASEPFRLRPVRPSAYRTMPVFVGVWEPEVSQPLHRQSPPSPPHQTASPATLHFVPRPWSLGDSKTGSPH